MSDINVTVFFATNRNRTKGTKHFGSRMATAEDGSALIHVGRSDVKVKASVRKKPWKANAGHITVGKPYIYGSKSSDLDCLAEIMCNSEADILWVLPGFYYSFLESVERAALLATLYSEDSSQPLAAMVFSWPSVRKLSGYDKDRTNVCDSGGAIALTIDSFMEYWCRPVNAGKDGNGCDKRVHLVAHSTGAFALQCAITSLSGRRDWLFDTVILAAADIDRDALERKDRLRPLARLAGSVHCYVNPGDDALQLADWVMGQPDRLGANGPINSNLADRFDNRLSIVDCRDLRFEWRWRGHRFRDDQEHQYYWMSPTVIDDIKEAMANLEPDGHTYRKWRVKWGRYRLVDSKRRQISWRSC